MKSQLASDMTPVESRAARQTEVVSGAVANIIFLVVLVLWGLFGWYAVTDSPAIDDWWQRFRDLDMPLQIAGGIIFLPWVVAVWVWQSGLALLFRVVISVMLALTTIGIFNPNRK